MSKPLFSRSEKLLLVALAFIQFAHIVDFMILMPLGPQLMRIFEIGPHQFSWLVSSYTLAAGTTGLFAAIFMDRYDRRSALLFMFVGFAMGTLACSLASHYKFLLVARIVTGAFGGILNSLIFSIVGDAIVPSKRATAMGTVMSSFALASVFGVPFSLFLANHWNWHTPFLFLGVLALVLVTIAPKVIPSMRSHLHNPKNEKWYTPFTLVLHSRNQVYALLFLVLLVFGQFTVIPFLSPSFVANVGLLETQLPFIYLVGGGVSIFSGPLVGRLADKKGKKFVFLIGAGLSLVPLYLLTHLGQTPLSFLLPLVAFFFFTMSGRMVPATALVTSTVHPVHRGSFMSIVSATQQFSAAGAAWLAGLMIEKTTTGQMLHYEKVGYIAIACSVGAIILNQMIVPIEGNNK